MSVNVVVLNAFKPGKSLYRYIYNININSFIIKGSKIKMLEG